MMMKGMKRRVREKSVIWRESRTNRRKRRRGKET